MKNFEKINAHFENTLTENGIQPPNELQSSILKRIRQGGDLLVIAPKGSGKTYAAIMAILLKCPDSQEGSPRVVYIGSDNNEVLEMTKTLRHLTRRKELMIEPANDKGKMVEQRVFIFQGADIVIGNPKRIYDLYIQNGLNMNKLNLLIMDNPEIFLKDSLIGELNRLSESLPNCQRIFLTEEVNSRTERIIPQFLNHPLILEATE
ncbi:MAG: DEAD/DEAH box helicase [Flavobacteriia bacterium]|nr:DEAD/DEAH box helicase [Flavobacteriia bacterium]OJX36180.1 MAG: hypothetical protein BGO87_06870 [Flavobacteriia bacterium 40-80]